MFLIAAKQYNYPDSGAHVINTETFYQLYHCNSDGNILWMREFDPITEIGYLRKNQIFIHQNTIFLFSGIHQRLVKVDINNSLSVSPTVGLLNGIGIVHQTPDSNLLIASASKYRLAKTNLNGQTIWAKYYGTNLPSNVSGDEIKSIIQDSVGNIYVTGRHYGDEYGTPNYSNADILTIMYDSSGNKIWQNRYEYGINNADIGNFIRVKNGYVYVGGQSQDLGAGTDYNYVVLKINSTNGALAGEYRYNGISSGNDVVSAIHVFDNANVVLAGLSHFNSTYDWTTQFLSDVVLSERNYQYENTIKLFPNPIQAGELLTVKGAGLMEYSILSNRGERVQSGLLQDNGLISLRTDNLSKGLYIIQLKTEQGTFAKQILVY